MFVVILIIYSIKRCYDDGISTWTPNQGNTYQCRGLVDRGKISKIPKLL